MSITKSFQEPKKEQPYAEAFIDFYLEKYYPHIKVVFCVCPDKQHEYRQPDYYCIEPDVLIELKEVHDREEVEVHAGWEKNIENLRKEMQKSKQLLKGSYIIDLPVTLRISNRRLRQKIANAILDAIQENKKEISIEGIGTLDIHFLNNKERTIDFSTKAYSRFISPVSTIYRNIVTKIETANTQMASYSADVTKRILLLVNKYIFGDRLAAFIEALSLAYRRLLDFEYIDEIWLQLEKQDGKYNHTLIYAKEFLTSFDQQKIRSDIDTISLFEKWFYPLSRQDDLCREKLIVALRKLIGRKKPFILFHDTFAREEMIGLGTWLIEHERYEEAMWLIDRFITDPDPADPRDYTGNPEFNYHEKILEGEDPKIITTVLGRLAWVVQKLAISDKYIKNALMYTKRLVCHPNLYVKLQAIIPLTEIAARRQLLKGYGDRPYSEEYKTFHKLTFDLVKLIKNRPNYTIIADWLTRVFGYYNDLSTIEAEQVLTALQISPESSALFIYFAIFREKHYKKQPIEFSAERFRAWLTDIIKADKKIYIPLREKVAWHFWRILDEDLSKFDYLRSYIDLLIRQPYHKSTYYYNEKIIETCFTEYPDICLSWYMTVLDQVEKTTLLKVPKTEDIWLVSAEKIVVETAKQKPRQLLELSERLVNLWGKGVFIGNIRNLFEAYSLISDDDLKQKVKQRYVRWYELMKKMNPEIGDANWEI